MFLEDVSSDRAFKAVNVSFLIWDHLNKGGLCGISYSKQVEDNRRQNERLVKKRTIFGKLWYKRNQTFHANPH